MNLNKPPKQGGFFMLIFKLKEEILWQNANTNLSEKPTACTVKNVRSY